jgi:alpha 1,2-mannosyltransferase
MVRLPFALLIVGFTISLHEYVETIPTLWESTKTFLKSHPEALAPNNALEFISSDNGESYNLCHFVSSFIVRKAYH